MTFLNYDTSKWQEMVTEPVNTLQLFVTNRCNLSCRDCFYRHRLGTYEMSLENYKEYVDVYRTAVQKIIILGGEPTMHPCLPEMIAYNNSLGLRTTLYTNGYDLSILHKTDLSLSSIRLSISSARGTEKAINRFSQFKLPIMVVYMLRKNNTAELGEVVSMTEKLGAKKFFISSIRDIARSGDYWKDTNETLPLTEYAETIQSFVSNYQGRMEIHISRRGVLKTDAAHPKVTRCRFGNIFPNGDKIICPFDICKNLTVSELHFDERKCNKHTECLLRKIVLKRI